MFKTIQNFVFIQFFMFFSWSASSQQIVRAEIPPVNFHQVGVIHTLTELNEGSIMVSGMYDMVNGEEISGMVKIGDDGQLDENFEHDLNGVLQVVEKENGEILAATGAGLFLLDATGGIISSLYSVDFGMDFRLLNNGQIVILEYGPENASNALRLIDENGDFVGSFSIEADGPINAIEISDTYVYVFGEFDVIDNHASPSIARFSLDWDVDENYVSEAYDWVRFGTTFFNRFTMYGDIIYYPGGSSTEVTRIQEDGTIDENFSYQGFITNDARPLYADKDGLLVYDSQLIVRLDETGEKDPTFEPQYVKDQPEFIYTATRLSGGDYFLGFSNGSVKPLSTLRLSETGVPVTMDFRVSRLENFAPFSLTRSGSELYVGGRFASINGDEVMANSLVRLNTSGELDADFNVVTAVPQFSFGEEIKFDHEGRLLVIGSQRFQRFDRSGNVAISGFENDIIEEVSPYLDGVIIMRQNNYSYLDANDEIDPTFVLPVNSGDIRTLHVLADSSLLFAYDESGIPFELRIGKTNPDLSNDQDFDLDIRGFFQILRMDEENFFASSYGDPLSGDVETNFAKFNISGELDQEFNDNYTGPTRLTSIKKVLNYFFFMGSSASEIHVTDLKGVFQEQLTNELNENITQSRLRDMVLIDKDSLMILGDQSADEGALSKIYINVPPVIEDITIEAVSKGSASFVL